MCRIYLHYRGLDDEVRPLQVLHNNEAGWFIFCSHVSVLVFICTITSKPVVFNLVKDPQIDTHQATDPYLIRCSLRDPSDKTELFT